MILKKELTVLVLKKIVIECNTLKKSYEDLFDLSKDLETEDDNDLENELNKNIVNTFTIVV